VKGFTLTGGRFGVGARFLTLDSARADDGGILVVGGFGCLESVQPCTQAERIGEQDDGRPAPISLRMDQRRVADAARSMHLYIRLHHSAGGGGNARGCSGSGGEGQCRKFSA